MNEIIFCFIDMVPLGQQGLQSTPVNLADLIFYALELV
jgi:hypothetical protein